MKVNTLYRPQAVSSKFVIQELPDELLLYNLETNKVFALNQTSALVWQNCDGNKTVTEIAKDLEKNLSQFVPDELVWLTLERLQSENLIKKDEESSLKDIMINRREILKKAGATTLVALPLISSLVAPKAVNAQSGIILQLCSVCLTKTHDAVLCTDTCQDIIVGDCHDNSGCGQGIFLNLVTCVECFAALPPMGPGSTVSWHGTQYK